MSCLMMLLNSVRYVGWQSRVSFDQVIDMMFVAELKLAKKERTPLGAG